MSVLPLEGARVAGRGRAPPRPLAPRGALREEREDRQDEEVLREEDLAAEDAREHLAGGLVRDRLAVGGEPTGGRLLREVQEREQRGVARCPDLEVVEAALAGREPARLEETGAGRRGAGEDRLSAAAEQLRV